MAVRAMACAILYHVLFSIGLPGIMVTLSLTVSLFRIVILFAFSTLYFSEYLLPSCNSARTRTLRERLLWVIVIVVSGMSCTSCVNTRSFSSSFFLLADDEVLVVRLRAFFRKGTLL